MFVLVMAALGSHPILTISFEQFYKVANLHRGTINLLGATVNIFHAQREELRPRAKLVHLTSLILHP